MPARPKTNAKPSVEDRETRPSRRSRGHHLPASGSRTPAYAVAPVTFLALKLVAGGISTPGLTTFTHTGAEAVATAQKVCLLALAYARLYLAWMSSASPVESPRINRCLPAGTYKAVNHGTCQPCATGTSARPGSTSCFAAATTTQEITFAIAASHWTGLVKSLAESAYALSLNIWDVTNKVVLPDYIVKSRAVAASHRSGTSTVTFTTIMPATAESTVKAVVAVVTANTMNTNQNMIKLFADAGTYGSVQPPTVTSVVNTGGPVPTMTPTTSRAVQLTCSMPYAFAADCLVSSSKL